jgi:hypothetical protein
VRFKLQPPAPFKERTQLIARHDALKIEKPGGLHPNVLTMSTDTKSNAANCVYQRIAVMIVDFPTDATYVYIDNVGRWIKIQMPDVLQQWRGVRHDLRSVPDIRGF